jgi:hypothetical protein
MSMQMMTPVPESQKQRCPTDNATQFYYVEQGLSYKCRHCKRIHIVTWEVIVQKYEEARRATPLQGSA